MANLSLEWANANPDPYLASAETGYANVTGANKGVILEIRRERTVELLMENFRYWDIMRWKEGKRFEKPSKGSTSRASARTTSTATARTTSVSGRAPNPTPKSPWSMNSAWTSN